ncbi:MAG: hypothetical protein IJ366_04020 [Clostridia bacterium]|nr:hypothetical protein [Clostridia bacterium]
MITTREVRIIEKSLEKGCDVIIKSKKNEIVIIEQKPKIIGRAEKSDKTDN